MGVHTLARMALGGLYDHLGGGFCRYSVDGEWMIPHFEKMLYDNGPLLALCAQAARLGAGNEDLFERTARETAHWAIREMQAPGGGFYAALDADSEGEEGRFYLWTPDAVRAVLDEEEFAAVAVSFGLDRPPNFEGREWHLHTFVERAGLAAKLGIDEAAAAERLDRARAKLFDARSPRVRPGLDDKILTSWNALMVSGLAVAGEALGEPGFIDAGVRAFEFLRAKAWVDGRLHAAWKEGRARFPAYLDDHAFLLEASLRLLQARWQPDRLDFAIEIADALLDRFEDRERGGFWFTAHDHEALMHRSKSFSDDSLPAGNGVAAAWLGRLGHLLGETRVPRGGGADPRRRMGGARGDAARSRSNADRARGVPGPRRRPSCCGGGESPSSAGGRDAPRPLRPGATSSRCRTMRRGCPGCSRRVCPGPAEAPSRTCAKDTAATPDHLVRGSGSGAVSPRGRVAPAAQGSSRARSIQGQFLSMKQDQRLKKDRSTGRNHPGDGSVSPPSRF